MYGGIPMLLILPAAFAALLISIKQKIKEGPKALATAILVFELVLLAITNLLLPLGRLKPLCTPLPCLALSLTCGLVWEFITPLYLPGSVSDLWDIAAYMIGGLIWCIIVNIVKRKC